MDNCKYNINKNYNIEINQVFENENNYYFYYDNEKYVYHFYPNNISYISQAVMISNELAKKNIISDKIIYNKNGDLISIFMGNNYVLIKCCDKYYNELDLINIRDFQNQTLYVKKINCNWGELWSKKIDSLEEKIRNKGIGKELLLNSFSYYVGLAENAISYFNMASEEYTNNSVNCVLSHRRIGYPCYMQAYLNPLGYILDFEGRDLSEYIKMQIINNVDIENDLAYLLKTLKWGGLEYSFFIARLLFPTFYFDLVDKLLDSKNYDIEIEKKIDLILKGSKEYEKVLKYIIEEINKKIPIKLIDWL